MTHLFGGNINGESTEKNDSTGFSFQLPASTTITATVTSTTNDTPVLSAPAESSTPVGEQAADSAPVFGALSGMSFADLAKNTNSTTATSNNANEAFGTSSGGLSFAALAQNNSPNGGGAAAFSRPPASGEFIGLTTRDTFSNLMRPTTSNGTSNDHNASADDNNENANDDATNYEPTAVFDPVIALPDEIQVSTGEEHENKLFGERAKLYRFDFDTKEVRKTAKNTLSNLKISNFLSFHLRISRIVEGAWCR